MRVSRPLRITRRHLQVVLGALWLLDGALQLQPFMFTSGFATTIVAPAAQGQPAFVADPIRFAAGLMAAHHVLADVAFAGVQLAIGVGLLLRHLVRAALAASMGWALGVWYLGEGLGGLAGGHTSLLAGAPGAAVLYVVLSAACWPAPAAGGDRPRWRARLDAGDSTGPPRRGVVAAWSVVWAGGALLRALPAQAHGRAVGAELAGAARGAPSWLAGWDHGLAAWAGSGGGALVAAVVGVEVLVAAMVLVGGRPRTVAATVGAVVALAQWVLGQGMGQLASGQATDPNAGLVLAVLAVGVLAAAPLRRQPESSTAGAPGGVSTAPGAGRAA